MTFHKGEVFIFLEGVSPNIVVRIGSSKESCIGYGDSLFNHWWMIVRAYENFDT